MKILKVSLSITHLFVAIFAFLGGWAAISRPMDPFGISTDMLSNSPFKTFLIPGMLLFIVIGLGQLLAAAFMLFRSRYQAYVSFGTGGVLLIWLLVQVLMIRTIEVLHVVTFAIACIQVALSLALMYKERLFPTDYVMRFINRHKHA
jgi:hypothetical protein